MKNKDIRWQQRFNNFKKALVRLGEFIEKKEAGTVTTRTKSKQKKLSYKDSLELEQIEEKIIIAESEVEKIEKIFASPDFYLKYASQTNELNQQLAEAKEKVKMLYERWDELERKKNDIIQ